MTVHDLERLELAYAPQFGSARDVLNIAGSVAANILKGDVETVSWRAVRKLDSDTHTLLDVRSDDEVRASGGTLPGAVHIHVDALRDHLHELDGDKIIIAYCTVSQRGYVAYRILVQNGFQARILSGGIETWEPPTEDLVEQGR
jgi:rhodanese-related sulfurtransferase